MTKWVSKRVVLCVLMLAVISLTMGFACAQQEDVYDYEWYIQPVQREEGKAYLSFWCDNAPIKVNYAPDRQDMPYFWDVFYQYEETNGVAFTVECITEVFFNEENEVRDVFVSTGPACSRFCRNITIQPWEVGGTNINRPVSSDTGYGVAVSGTDANGNELTFGFYVPLSQEIQKNYTLDDLTKKIEKEDGKAYMVLSPTENPAPLLEKSDSFGGENGWFYGFEILNQSEVAFTPDELIELCFYKGYVSWQSVYSAQQMTDWGAPAVYEPNTSWVMTGGMPQQDVSGVGYLLTGTDANGNKLEFGTYIELERK
ncbi:MAG: hypothetical protein IKJ26_04850 [Clostridia bacterium]|nr:hypothetical protein [Clostridia bacterium]